MLREDRFRMDTLVMAKKKPSKSKVTVLGIRCSEEWRDWLDQLAEHCRLNKVDVVDIAVVEYAKRVGFEPKPPKR